ncbi:MAG: Clp protease N-terminal domain-containing protein [Actinomycetota bacterium]
MAAARTREIGAVDILLGVLEGQGIAIKVLRRLGVDVGRARTTLRKLLDSEAQ